MTRTTETIRDAGHITPDDARRVYLLVGFVEYGNALANFSELLQTATDEELDAMNRIVGEREEFAVYTNLAAQVQRGPSTLSVGAGSVGETQQGFDWVIALARTEFGAMLAGFSDLPSPFSAVPLHPYDANAYRQLLLDGAATHYWSLVNDPSLNKVTKTSPERPIVLAYSRRLVVARAMLTAAMRFGQQQYSNVQMRELSSWKDSMDELQAGFIAKIQLYLQTFTASNTSTDKRQSDYTQACGAMLRAEAREVRAGTAKQLLQP